MTQLDNTPILIGVGQQTWHDKDSARSPVDALQEVAELALNDCGESKIRHAIDALVGVAFIATTNPDMAPIFPRNPQQQLAQRLGIENAQCYQGTIGGNTPQYLVNHFANKLAMGKHSAVLISGAELLASLFSAFGTGEDISHWADSKEGEPTILGKEREGLNAQEKAHGLYEPINTYPLFENSFRHSSGTSFDTHQANVAKLCSAMSGVAANNPLAWRPLGLSTEEITTVSEKNRYIGYPYTKAMNPVLAVNMGAAMVMTTVGEAKRLGIDSERWIYLRGGADANDIWYISERFNLHESPAIRLATQQLMTDTGVTLDELEYFDLYSCFPSAVQIACKEIELDLFDARGVTVTGGLPYFGGPGNNYSLHAIAEMVNRLRGKGSAYGLVSANGMYLTKHSLGLYSAHAPDRSWSNPNNASLQKQIESLPRTRQASNPAGKAIIETYTVAFGKEGPQRGIIVAKNKQGERIFANTKNDLESMQQLINADPIGQNCTISCDGAQNIAEL